MTNGDGLGETTTNSVEIKAMTAAEITGLVNLFNSMMMAMEGRLIAKMDENSKGASDRWSKHDLETKDENKRVADRFVKLEKALDEHLQIANIHFAKEHDQEIIMEARVKPVKTVAGYIAKNWKTIMLVISLIALSILSWVEGVEHFIGEFLP